MIQRGGKESFHQFIPPEDVFLLSLAMARQYGFIAILPFTAREIDYRIFCTPYNDFGFPLSWFSLAGVELRSHRWVTCEPKPRGGRQNQRGLGGLAL